MKCIIKHLALVLLFVGVAMGNEQEVLERPTARAVEDTFSSVGSGIDEHAYEQIFSMATESLASGKATLISRVPWGKEGEVTLCIQMRHGIEAYSFEQSITPIIASDDSKKPRTKASLILTCPVIE